MKSGSSSIFNWRAKNRAKKMKTRSGRRPDMFRFNWKKAYTTPDTHPASPAPAPGPMRYESAVPFPCLDNTSPSSATPAGWLPVPARTERSGIGSVSRDESNTPPRAGSGSAFRAVPATGSGSASDIRICVRKPPASCPQIRPLATGRLPSGKPNPFDGNIPYIPAGTRI